MSFGRTSPPLVPDPGQQVDLLAENGQILNGFRAVSGPLSYERGGVVVWVATGAGVRGATRAGRPAGGGGGAVGVGGAAGAGFRGAKREGRPAVSMPWPAGKVMVHVPWWKWQ